METTFAFEMDGLICLMIKKTLVFIEVDEANVDTSSFVESPNRWIWALEAWACYKLRIKIEEFEIVGVQGGVNLGSAIKDVLPPNVVL